MASSAGILGAPGSVPTPDDRALGGCNTAMSTQADADDGGTTLAQDPQRSEISKKVSYDEPLAVPKGYDMSPDRQEATSRCVVAPVIAAFKAITSQAEGTAMDARGAPPPARRRCPARDYCLAHRQIHRPLESSQCRPDTQEAPQRNSQPG